MSEFSPSGGVRGGLLSKIMNKKAYITPEMEVMNIETVDMMATSLLIDGETEVDTSKDGTQLGHGRRGTWGNLWYEE